MFLDGCTYRGMMKKYTIFVLLFSIMLTTIMWSTKCYASQKADYDKIVNILKEELGETDLQSPEDIRNHLREAQEEYNVELTEDETQKIVDVVDTINTLGIDKETLINIVDDVYENVGDKLDGTRQEVLENIEQQVIDSATEAVAESIKKSVKKTVTDYISDFWDTITQFVSGITF